MKTIKEDNSQSSWSRRLVSGDSFLPVVFGLSALIIVSYFADLGRGRAAAVCAAIDGYIAKKYWESITRLWLWCAITLILAIQIAVVYFVHWSAESLPSYGLIPVGIVVYLLNEAIVGLVRKGATSAEKK